jgi:hypothetical protein
LVVVLADMVVHQRVQDTPASNSSPAAVVMTVALLVLLLLLLLLLLAFVRLSGVCYSIF